MITDEKSTGNLIFLVGNLSLGLADLEIFLVTLDILQFNSDGGFILFNYLKFEMYSSSKDPYLCSGKFSVSFPSNSASLDCL